MVNTLVQRLKSEGFLKPAQGGKLIRSDSPDQAAIRQRVYYNPMTLIGHYISSLSRLFLWLGYNGQRLIV